MNLLLANDILDFISLTSNTHAKVLFGCVCVAHIVFKIFSFISRKPDLTVNLQSPRTKLDCKTQQHKTIVVKKLWKKKKKILTNHKINWRNMMQEKKKKCGKVCQ